MRRLISVLVRMLGKRQPDAGGPFVPGTQGRLMMMRLIVLIRAALTRPQIFVRVQNGLNALQHIRMPLAKHLGHVRLAPMKTPDAAIETYRESLLRLAAATARLRDVLQQHQLPQLPQEAQDARRPPEVVNWEGPGGRQLAGLARPFGRHDGRGAGRRGARHLQTPHGAR